MLSKSIILCGKEAKYFIIEGAPRRHRQSTAELYSPLVLERHKAACSSKGINPNIEQGAEVPRKECHSAKTQCHNARSPQNRCGPSNQPSASPTQEPIEGQDEHDPTNPTIQDFQIPMAEDDSPQGSSTDPIQNELFKIQRLMYLVDTKFDKKVREIRANLEHEKKLINDKYAKMGATISLLPPELKNSYNIWVESSPHLQQVTKLVDGMCEFYFFAQAQIPWIWNWNVELNIDPLNLKCLVRNFSIKWWTAIIVLDKNKQIEKVIQNNLLKTQRSPVKPEFSLKKIHKNLKKLYPHETEEQIKQRLQKFYEDQMADIFSVEDDLSSQHSDDTMADRWPEASERGPSQRPGKQIMQEEDSFI
ncbi:hypothetical protein M5K25_010383 [Dendrobium thyrsiflorum]|uniref:Uncharacterized protein n=1 Tax=Dendrobium thyrsiflorum TaxID=117978 RepID=A0ABD0UZH9_DENTH